MTDERTEGRIAARVLIVEDEAVVAKDLERSLGSIGYVPCGICRSGADAIEKARTTNPHLVLMDIHLRGEIDGIEAARRIREEIGVPVVFLTAYADDATIARASSAQAFGYVLKPFVAKELHATIATVLDKHHAFAQLDRQVAERTRELERSESRYRRLEAVAELGLAALGTLDLAWVMERALRVAGETLGTEFGSVLEILPGGEALQLRAATGWDAGRMGDAVRHGRDSHAGFTLLSKEPVVVEDFAAETRFRPSDLLREHGIASGISVVLHAPGPELRTYGVLAVHSRRARSYSLEDVQFLKAVANVVAAAIGRRDAEDRARVAERTAEEERAKAGEIRIALREHEDFIVMAGHELRTPLSALQLKMDGIEFLLCQEPLPLDKVMTRFGSAMRQIQRMGNLIDHLLDVSRIVAGRLEVRPEELDLVEVVRHSIEELREQADDAGCEVRLSAPAPVRGSWDRQRLEQAILNLLGNAIKYGEGQPVEISVALGRSGLAELEIEDRGIGIPPAEYERIFERFARAAPGHFAGLGLGLFVTGRIVEAHGGRIGVSGAPGGGARFKVELPVLVPEEV